VYILFFLTLLSASEVSDSRGTQTRSLRRRGGPSEKDSVPGREKRRLNPPHINYALREPEMLEDIELINKALGMPTKVTPNPGSHDVFVDRGVLNFEGSSFEKGQEIIVSDRNDQTWTGTLVVVNPAEIHIRVADGSKSRFSLQAMRNSKFKISLAR